MRIRPVATPKPMTKRLVSSGRRAKAGQERADAVSEIQRADESSVQGAHLIGNLDPCRHDEPSDANNLVPPGGSGLGVVGQAGRELG